MVKLDSPIAGPVTIAEGLCNCPSDAVLSILVKKIFTEPVTGILFVVLRSQTNVAVLILSRCKEC
jgi:hypothetical protein